jgi:hypothetical protein
MLTFLELYSPVTLRKIKSQLFLTKVRWWYFHILLRQEALVFCIRLEAGKAVVMPDLGDLSVLVKEDGQRIFQLKVQSPGRSHKAILNDDDYRRKLAMTNYKQRL